MRIDAHQHFWVYDQSEYAWIDDSMASLRRDFLPNDLKIELGRKGFQGCVAVQARQTLEETRWLLDLATHASFILGVVGWVDLQSPDARSQLEAFAGNPKLVGIRHIVQAEPNDRFLLQPEFLRGISLLEEFDLAYDLLIYPKHLPVAAEFVRRFPRQRFVLDHLAKPPIKSGSLRPWERGMRELGTLPNVFCKLSGLVTEADWQNWKPEHIAPYMDVAFETFGPRRLMIGSDWPVCTLAASYTRAIDLVESYLSQHATEVQEAALGGNAQQFWKLGTRQKQLPGDSQHTVGNGKNKREGDAAHASRRGCARNEK
jgi:L-fucono-1,5-lactonase